jgi:thioredoxin reductase (NADPH)
MYDTAIVGAGPVGIELAILLRDAGLDVLHLDAGQVGQTMFDWPPETRWFSSPDRIAIAGVPIQGIAQEKCTREEYLAYLRAVVLQHGLDIRTFERVISLSRRDAGGFEVATRTLAGAAHAYEARTVVLATGGNNVPHLIDIPGEDLPHVSHDLGDPHRYFGKRVVVIGGRNSAVEAALRCHRVGADVTIVYRGEAFPSKVKYWLRPEIEYLVKVGTIRAHFRTTIKRVTTDGVVVSEDGNERTVDADFVLLMTGYDADLSLFRSVGAELRGPGDMPVHDETTMETTVPGLYVAGVASAGMQHSGVTVFLENCHVHAERIAATLTGGEPPAQPKPVELPEA